VRRSARAVYVTLNPFDRERIADSGVSDDAVTRRHWLPIDVDPIRDDPKTNATDGSALRPQWPKASSTDERRGEMAAPGGLLISRTRGGHFEMFKSPLEAGRSISLLDSLTKA
jgi:hypothetical protein